jgi:hypothetical protein
MRRREREKQDDCWECKLSKHDLGIPNI